MATRPDYDTYFMNIAEVVATRGTCLRKQVGALIVLDRHVVSTGYNGSIPGQPHCTDEGVGCMMEDGHCVRTVHAELNAIVQAARHGVRVDGGTAITTASPCWPCYKAIVSAGIKKIIFGELYRDERIYSESLKAGITLVDMSKA